MSRRFHRRIQRSRITRLGAAALLAASALAGAVALPATHARADTTLCPTKEADITSAMANGGTVSLSCTQPTTISFATTGTGTTGNAGTGRYTVAASVNLDAGTSPAPITFDGYNANQFFFVNSGKTLGINGLTLQNGYADKAAGANSGGAIRVQGTLNLTNSTLSGNSTNGANGGGALAINANATTTISGDTFVNNSALSNGTVSNGGGAISDNGTVTVTNSTFVGNTAPSGTNGGEGGAAIVYPGHTATFTNDTFHGNSAGGRGAAIFNQGTADIAGDIFEGNLVGALPKSCGGVTDWGYNLSDDASCLQGGTGDIQGTSNLDSNGLQNNGGPTQTVALIPGAPATDLIPTSYDLPNTTTPLCPATDQRGAPRPDNGESACDAGAFEHQVVAGGCPTSGDATTSGSLANLMANQPYAGTAIALNCPVPTTIQFDGAGNSGTITVAQSGGLDASHSAAPITLDGGHTAMNTGSQLFSVNSGVTFALNDLTVANGGNGGISNAGTLIVRGVTFSGNTGPDAGAIDNTGTFTAINSTFAGNTSAGGAAINNAGTALVTSSTFSGNMSTGPGGAIYNTTANGAAILSSDLLSGNTPANCSNPNGGGIDDGGFNLDSDSTCTTSQPGDTTGNADLGPLANNGGQTATFALLPGSAAIGGGNPVDCRTSVTDGGVDQRGYLRHASVCDIGAFESGARPDHNDLTATGPGLTNLYPNTITAGAGDTTLTIEGQNFDASDSVTVGSASYTPTVVSASVITVTVPSTDLTAPVVDEVQVTNGSSNASNRLPLYVTAQADTVSSFNSGSSTATTGGQGSGTPGSVSATQTGGDGPIQVAQYTGAPTAATVSGGQDYFDVHIAGSNLPTGITVADCNATAGSLHWLDPGTGQWSTVSNVASANGCLTATLDANTSPSITQLNGTIFGGSSNATRALVSAAHVTRSGKTSILHWTMASQMGVIGFRVYGQGRLLTARPIATHAAARYTYRTTHAGPYRLQVILPNGSTANIPIR